MEWQKFLEKSSQVQDLDKIEYLEQKDYKYSDKVQVRCLEHGTVSEQSVINHLKGRTPCKQCAKHKKSAARVMTEDEFHKKIKEAYSGQIVANYSRYKKNSSVVDAHCNVHGYDFEAIASQLFAGKLCCDMCFEEQMGYKKICDKQYYLDKFKEAHGDKYEYEDFDASSRNNYVSIYCEKHDNLFSQTLGKHASGQTGCKACEAERVAESRTFWTQGNFNEFLKTNHPHYIRLTDYKRREDLCTLYCDRHESEITTRSSYIISGIKSPCPDCRSESASILNRLGENDFYLAIPEGYSASYSQYVNGKSLIDVYCQDHQITFKRNMENIKRYGAGCPECDYGNVSKGEKEILEFVNSLVGDKVSVLNGDRKAIKPMELDVYVPSAKFAIEYNGNYYHSTQFKKPSYHYDKYKRCKDAGVDVMFIWEHEWNDPRQKEILKGMIKNRLGKNHGKKAVRASSCTVEEISNNEFYKFCQENHIQGGFGSNSLCIGLYSDHTLVCAAGFVDRGDHYNLTRFCASEKVHGGLGKIMKHFKAMNLTDTITTFSDNEKFEGFVYEKLGFVYSSDVKYDYKVFHSNYGVWHKFAWRRGKIPLRLREIGSDIDYCPDSDERTEKDIQLECGALRLYDAGKKKWVMYL